MKIIKRCLVASLALVLSLTTITTSLANDVSGVGDGGDANKTIPVGTWSSGKQGFRVYFV